MLSPWCLQGGSAQWDVAWCGSLAWLCTRVGRVSPRGVATLQMHASCAAWAGPGQVGSSRQGAFSITLMENTPHQPNPAQAVQLVCSCTEATPPEAAPPSPVQSQASELRCATPGWARSGPTTHRQLCRNGLGWVHSACMEPRPHSTLSAPAVPATEPQPHCLLPPAPRGPGGGAARWDPQFEPTHWDIPPSAAPHTTRHPPPLLRAPDNSLHS